MQENNILAQKHERKTLPLRVPFFVVQNVGTRRALSEEFKARMSLKTQVPRLSVLINNNRGISDVRFLC